MPSGIAIANCKIVAINAIANENAHILNDDVRNRSLILEGHAQIAFEEVAQPVEITFDDCNELISARCDFVGHIHRHDATV